MRIAWKPKGGRTVKKLVFLTLAVVIGAATLAAAGEHLVGGPPGSGGNTIPFWGTRSYMRWQVIWFQTEIGEAGPISKLEFQNYSGSSSSGGVFNGCKFILCHTSLSTITSTYANNYDGKTPVTVFDGTFNKTETTPSAWYTLFENPTTTLNYNNSDNLLFEVSWTSSTGGSNYDMRKSSGGAGRVYNYSTLNPTTGTVTSGYAHYARVTVGYTGVAPTSLGRIKSLYN
jgi:hypothetical protein